MINEIKVLNGLAFWVCGLHSDLFNKAFPKIGSREAQNLNRAPRNSSTKAMRTVFIPTQNENNSSCEPNMFRQDLRIGAHPSVGLLGRMILPRRS